MNEQTLALINEIDGRFRSGNSIAIDRVWLTAEAWAAMRETMLSEVKAGLEQIGWLREIEWLDGFDWKLIKKLEKPKPYLETVPHPDLVANIVKGERLTPVFVIKDSPNAGVDAYKIANNFDAHRNSLPNEFQDWADEISRDLRTLAAAPAAQVVASDEVRRLVGKLDQWRLSMSHNESYFGDPAGLVKSTVEALARAVDPIYPPMPTAPNPLDGVAIHTVTVPYATSAAPAVVVDEARPLEEWSEDDGLVVWWKFPVNEPSYIGSPLCSDWPGYHTHWTPHPKVPTINAARCHGTGR